MSAQPQRPEPSIRQQLAQLDLELVDLQFALRVADAERRTCSPLDPPVLPSWLTWAKTIGALRDRLVPRGWTPSDRHNVPRIIHPSGRFGIIVNTGDAGTGDLRFPVGTKYPRGQKARLAVETNAQLAFNGLEPSLLPDADLLQTWILLIRFRREAAHAELSLPREISSGGHITHWSRRIALPPLDFGDRPRPDEGEGPDFDVPVSRR